MMKICFKICILILFVTPGVSFAAGGEQENLAQLKTRAIKRLMARKKGFDAYQKKLESFERRRLAVAYKQKAVRSQYAAQREKARKSFTRTHSSFPKQAYQRFLAARKKKIKNLEKARSEYSVMQKELEKVYKRKEYNIDAKKEFKL